MKKKIKKVTAEIVDDLVEENISIDRMDDNLDSSREILDVTDDVVLPKLIGLGQEANHSVALVDPVLQYIQEIKRYPLLTREEETELAKKYFETKDPIAAQKLVTSNLRFVVKVAGEYAKFGARLIDLIQEGNIGLLHAVKEYNPHKGVRLISYAVWWIRGYIQEYLMKQYSLVKIGTTQNQKKLFYRLQKEKASLEKIRESGDYSELAHRLGVNEHEVKDMADRLSGRDLSLSVSVNNDSGASFLDLQKDEHLPPDEMLSRAEELSLLRHKILELRQSLNEKELILLDERILADVPATLQDIADRYQITREAVRQSETRLIQKLKKLMIENE